MAVLSRGTRKTNDLGLQITTLTNSDFFQLKRTNGDLSTVDYATLLAILTDDISPPDDSGWQEIEDANFSAVNGVGYHDVDGSIITAPRTVDMTGITTYCSFCLHLGHQVTFTGATVYQMGGAEALAAPFEGAICTVYKVGSRLVATYGAGDVAASGPITWQDITDTDFTAVDNIGYSDSDGSIITGAHTIDVSGITTKCSFCLHPDHPLLFGGETVYQFGGAEIIDGPFGGSICTVHRIGTKLVMTYGT